MQSRTGESLFDAAISSSALAVCELLTGVADELEAAEALNLKLSAPSGGGGPQSAAGKNQNKNTNQSRSKGGAAGGGRVRAEPLSKLAAVRGAARRLVSFKALAGQRLRAQKR